MIKVITSQVSVTICATAVTHWSCSLHLLFVLPSYLKNKGDKVGLSPAVFRTNAKAYKSISKKIETTLYLINSSVFAPKMFLRLFASQGKLCLLHSKISGKMLGNVFRAFEDCLLIYQLITLQ